MSRSNSRQRFPVDAAQWIWTTSDFEDLERRIDHDTNALQQIIQSRRNEVRIHVLEKRRLD